MLHYISYFYSIYFPTTVTCWNDLSTVVISTQQCKLFLSILEQVNTVIVINILFSYLFCHLLDFFSLSVSFGLKKGLRSAALKGWMSPLTSPSVSHPLIRSFSSLFQLLTFFSQLISYLGIPLSFCIFVSVSHGLSIFCSWLHFSYKYGNWNYFHAITAANAF